ncbi:hypothetical protein MPH_08117 [Macrophomina phaseolina MS6]|uniref:Uncharacterized protein n=1 Tax=Macrophomina phaseolina (strain MS6) TaxID=1126212 RepID=K2RWT2_MACPH|nr:hypothetical protein MPH_08117 [Macrophomina phaseolina MS6]
MANFLRNKAVWAVSATVGALYFVPKLTGNKSNVFETPGTQNIGNRWSAGGGAPTHTPAGATKRGDPNSVEPSTHNPADVTSKAFQDNIASQRPGSGEVCSTVVDRPPAAAYSDNRRLRSPVPLRRLGTQRTTAKIKANDMPVNSTNHLL